MQENTLRWTDPYGSWGNHDRPYYFGTCSENKSKYDTGLCNRLLHWEIASKLVEYSKEDVDILIQKKIWPELELLELPNTIGISLTENYAEYQSKYDYDALYLKTVFDIENNKTYQSKPITETKLISLIKNKKITFKSGKHWYSDFGYHSLRSIYTHINQKDLNYNLDFSELSRPLKKIKLKHTYISNLLETKMKDFVGIHIRRGNGVTFKKEQDVHLQPEIADSFYKWRSDYVKEQDELYEFYPDTRYFFIIDMILTVNPKQEFYISHDMPDEFIKPFYDRYGKKIIESKMESRHHFEEFYSSCGIDVPKLINYGNVIDNVMDLFSLSNCPMMIISPNSSWSEFAYTYKNIGWHEPNDDIENILNGYKSAFKIGSNLTLI